MRGIRKTVGLLLMLSVLCLCTGCSMLTGERVRMQDLGFTVVSEEKVPAELKSIIDEKKADPFKLTYSDAEYLYIVIGYGQQLGGGYSIAVNELYLTEDAIFVNTTLLGPEGGESADKAPSWPYIVLKLDYLEKPVIFE